MEDQPHPWLITGEEVSTQKTQEESRTPLQLRSELQNLLRTPGFLCFGSRLLNQEKTKRPSIEGEQRCTSELQSVATVLK